MPVSDRHRVLFVVLAPPEARGIYDSWTACTQAIEGRHGVHLETARSRDEAMEILRRAFR